jgi:EAL domain-containing protein (putative c-di-GMP-specific phosphodiesterase class I)
MAEIDYAEQHGIVLKYQQLVYYPQIEGLQKRRQNAGLTGISLSINCDLQSLKSRVIMLLNEGQMPSKLRRI